ncbi:uncharacterized protein LOC130983163 [Arachis stenosperma]|uniref:uncharacterized protein LOC130983163 n=1 Tax=Arachis stenosperma TaxID=217475 RepID=UPI0025ABE0A5|nr:uncharacterized protein LOC130983163 [Arachis stenosperma]
MLKLFTHSLGRAESSAPERDHKKSKSHVKKKGNNKRGTKAKVSPDVSLTSNDFVVRIVHKGGLQEVYQRALPASKLMRKYPGMCVASPEVFKDPHQSVLGPDQVLLLGHKYIMISPRDVHKLKRKHAQQGENEENNAPAIQELSPAEEVTRDSPCGHQTRESSNKASNEANGAQGQEMMERKKSLYPDGGIEEVQGGGPAREPHGYAKDVPATPNKEPSQQTQNNNIPIEEPAKGVQHMS